MVQSDVGATQDRSLLVVAGSGRSGTSLMAGLTSKLGMRIPQPELKANDSNPSGFGEPRWAVGFHKELLRSVDVTHEDARPSAWGITSRVAQRERARGRLRTWLEEQFEDCDRVVVKDPRMAWFLELYRSVATDLSVDLSVVTMLRHPAETVRSRQMAYTSKIEAATRMAGWLNMMLSVELATRDLPRAIIKYDDLLARWRQTLDMAEELLPVNLTTGATAEQIDAADQLVNPSLRRAAPDWDELHLQPTLQDLAERAYRELGALAVTPDGSPRGTSTDAIDEIRAAYASHYLASETLVRSTISAARASERRRLQRQQETEQATTQSDTLKHQPGGRVEHSPSSKSPPPTAGRVLTELRQRAASVLGKRRA